MDSLSGLRVLVVEDEVLVAWLLQDMLAGFGCAVVGPAARVNEALAMIEAGGIDAAVLDINLNGQKSYPVADALAAGGIPFVFSTGYGKGRFPEGYCSFAVLQKPYQSTELRDALTQLLNSKEVAHFQAAEQPSPQGSRTAT